MRAHFTPGQAGYRNLLLTIGALLTLRPLVAEWVTLTWSLPLFFTLTILMAVWVISSDRRQLLGLAVLATFGLLGFWSEQLGTPLLGGAVISLAMMIFFGWVAVILARDVFRSRSRISADVIYGGVDVYLLVGLSFAGAHHALALLSPGSILGLGLGSELSDATYYSYVTLTTLGYGDITPVSEAARMLTFVEALIGQLYLAILLARLVALHLSGHDANGDSQGGLGN